MARLFRNHVWLCATPGGGRLLRWVDDLDLQAGLDAAFRTYVGPRPVELAPEMTAEEFNGWEAELLTRGGFRVEYDIRGALGGPAVAEEDYGRGA